MKLYYVHYLHNIFSNAIEGVGLFEIPCPSDILPFFHSSKCTLKILTVQYICQFLAMLYKGGSPLALKNWLLL